MSRGVFGFVKAFVLGSGAEPDIGPFESAMKEIRECGATSKRVNLAWKLWRQYLKDGLLAMPLHKRMFKFMPYSYRENLLGWIAFLADNDLLDIDRHWHLNVKIVEEESRLDGENGGD